MDVIAWLTLISAGAAAISAIVALVSVHHNNRQFLFDKRLKLYESLIEILDNCKDAHDYLKPLKFTDWNVVEVSPSKLANLLYDSLTASPSFYQIQSLSNTKNDELILEFNKTIKELNILSNQSRMILKKKHSQLIFIFIQTYIDVLKKLIDQCGKNIRYHELLDKVKNNYNGIPQCKELMIENKELDINIELLYHLYDMILENNCLEWIEKQLNLC